MLMHASTHSSNFDENTAATAFTFTVIAYQWGWNYFFPRDVVDTLLGAPRMVGRGRLFQMAERDAYARLLAKKRSETLARLSVQGKFAARNGRLNISSAVSLFARPISAPEVRLEPLATRRFIQPNSRGQDVLLVDNRVTQRV
jgi:heme/copper-type cytochrome/quinol oxidase subunit 2